MSQTIYSKHLVYKQILIILLMIIFVFLFFSSLSFLNSAFLGSITLYVLLIPLYKWLFIKKRWKSWVAIAFLMIISVLILLIPFYFVLNFLYHKLKPFVNNPQPIIESLEKINQFIIEKFNIQVLDAGFYSKLIGFANKLLPKLLGSGVNMFTNLSLMYFILWFLLSGYKKIRRSIRYNIFFSKKHTLTFIQTFNKNVISNSLGIYILGFLQGIVATIGYWIFGIDEPFVWGMITAVASVIPVVGTMAVWIPLSIYLMALGNFNSGIFLGLYGLLIIGGSDNVFRFVVQKKLAEVHPLISIFGVLFGLQILGFWGIVYGPVSLVMIFALYKWYVKEYINSTNQDSAI